MDGGRSSPAALRELPSERFRVDGGLRRVSPELAAQYALDQLVSSVAEQHLAYSRAEQGQPSSDLGDQSQGFRCGQPVDDDRFLPLKDRQLDMLMQRRVEVFHEWLGCRPQRLSKRCEGPQLPQTQPDRETPVAPAVQRPGVGELHDQPTDGGMRQAGLAFQFGEAEVGLFGLEREENMEQTRTHTPTRLAGPRHVAFRSFSVVGCPLSYR